MSDFGAGKEPGEQGGIEWLMERVGNCTASRFKDVMDKLKNGQPGAKRKAYLWEMVCERLTGEPAAHYANTAMEWGTEQEAFSRMSYEAHTKALVVETGFIKHPTIQFVGGSPDGVIDDDGGWESKSPYNSAVHLQTWLNGMPEEHMAQIQGLMWITGRAWWDFTSYDPRMPAPLDLYIQRIPRDQAYIDALEAEIIVFLGEVAELVTRLQQVSGTAGKSSAPPPASSPAGGAPSGHLPDAVPAAGADSDIEALLVLARDWADCGTEKYKKFWIAINDDQRKAIGAERHAAFKAIAEKVPQ